MITIKRSVATAVVVAALLLWAEYAVIPSNTYNLKVLLFLAILTLFGVLPEYNRNRRRMTGVTNRKQSRSEQG